MAKIKEGEKSGPGIEPLMVAQVKQDSTMERLAAIVTTDKRKYRTAMMKRSVDNEHSLRKHKCLTVYTTLNGVKALTLFDSRYSINAVSLEFTRVVNLKPF